MFFNSTRTVCLLFFFFNDTATTEIYTLSLHDALPISASRRRGLQAGGRGMALRIVALGAGGVGGFFGGLMAAAGAAEDRKSTRLNSSHANISYAVFCLKKKKKKNI